MIQIGDRVCAGSRNDTIARGVVVDIIPANEYRQAMYRIRFDSTGEDIVTLTPTPNESWVDAGMVYGPFIDQNIGWNN